MASKTGKVPKHSFIPSRTVSFEDYQDSEQSEPPEDIPELNITDNFQEEHQEQIDRLNEEVQDLSRQLTQLKHKNKELKDNLDLAEIKAAKHEQKQRELIKKLSHEQISNRQLEYEMKKISEELFRAKENSKMADHRNFQANNSSKRAQEERTLFIQCFRKIADVIGRCDKIEDFNSCMRKFSDFVKQNIKNYESSDPNSQFQFSLKFELGQVNLLKQKNGQLESKIWKMKEEVQKERNQKRRIISSYNEKLNKLREHCDQLRARIEERDDDNQYEINNLKKMINEKNDIISGLKSRIDTEQKRKDSMCSKKSRVRKKSYFIGDGQKNDNDLKMCELESQIEQLERELIQELSQ